MDLTPMDLMPMDLMRARSLRVDQRLSGIDFDLQRGETVGLIGPNGAGKSTLLQALASLIDYSGTIELNGAELSTFTPKQRAQHIAMQPQFVDSSWSLSVADIVSFGRIPWGDMDTLIIQQAMQEAGVEGLAKRRIDELSGGEKARVWLARVLANQAQVLLMDEIVANLDLHYQHTVLKGLRAYSARGNGVVIAIHDLSLAALYCDRLVLLDQGKVVRSGATREVLQSALLQQVFDCEVKVDLDSDPPVVLGL